MIGYNPQKIEPKWQKYWEKEKPFEAKDFSRNKKPKFYCLVEFPYPSGDGLHVGHCRPYIALDVLSRKRRMQGQNVLFPMGWDAFGLPSENYAVKTGIHPKITTKKNAANFKRQEKSLGFSFDWNREILTTDPGYYKWTQWIFVKLFERGLAYKAKMPINWCLSCKIGLANEEVVEGKCERCGSEVEKREKEQWLLKITKYANRLLDDLKLVDYPEKVKILQRDWIGRSEGAEIYFNVKCQNLPTRKSGSRQAVGTNVKSNPKSTCQNLKIKVFTTRPDTLFGATFMVVSPENDLIANYELQITNYEEVRGYIKKAKKKSDLERTDLSKDKTGVELKGIKALNPANGKEIPVFVADYVMMGYGTGAIMAVPGHDQRDWQFAKKYNLEIKPVIKGGDLEQGAFEEINQGIMINSGEFNGLRPNEAMKKITLWLEQKGIGKRAVNYKLRDWVFSRQRYWGEPIPLVFCEQCRKKLMEKLKIKNEKLKIKENNYNQGELLNPGWISVSEKDLPVELPGIKDFKPAESGESPLAKEKKWAGVKCPKCGGSAQRETDVMPNWAGSNWYYLAYLIKKSQKSKVKSQKYKSKVKNNKYIWDKEKMRYWLPVDWYNGGMEHTTLHLLYSRFIYKFLWDIGAVPREIGPEPYKKRTSHGMVLGEGGIKMSKSKGNIINPDDVIAAHGADAARVYEMFMGPFSQAIAWDTKGLLGVKRFLQKVWRLFEKSQIPNPKSQTNSKSQIPNLKLEKLLHQTIKKVSEDIEAMKFNTAAAALMILANAMEQEKEISLTHYSLFLILLSPFAPHICEELWRKLGNKKSICLQKWPEYDKNLIKEEKINLIVQINGKVREKIEVSVGISEEEAKNAALGSGKIQKWLEGREIKKIVFIPGKIINIVI